MGQIKNYLLRLQELCSDQKFGQDAVEWAVLSGWFKPTYNLEADLCRIFSPQMTQTNADSASAPSAQSADLPPETLYDQMCEAWRRRCRELEEQSWESMQPLLEEILGRPNFGHPVPLAPAS